MINDLKKTFPYMLLIFALTYFITACGYQEAEQGTQNVVEEEQQWDFEAANIVDSMELSYATQFAVEYYENGASLITIAGQDQYLLLEEDMEEPQNLPESVTIIHKPVENIYLAASSAMDLFHPIDGLGQIRMTSTKAEDWSLADIREAVEQQEICYVGKYSAPDYEQILEKGCDLTIESTMIYHTPKVQEQLENLQIPVMVERSSYESHPLGRLEWVRLYGELLDKQQEADEFFFQTVEDVEQLELSDSVHPTVAFFSITSNGAVNVRKPGDYISRMIELAGGSYVLSDMDIEAENALSTMNMDMETFYHEAQDADYLIYNSTIEGSIRSVDELIAMNELLKDFKAVKEGNVWCTEKNTFQQTTGVGEMMKEFHAIFSGAEQTDDFVFLHHVSN